MVDHEPFPAKESMELPDSESRVLCRKQMKARNDGLIGLALFGLVADESSGHADQLGGFSGGTPESQNECRSIFPGLGRQKFFEITALSV